MCQISHKISYDQSYFSLFAPVLISLGSISDGNQDEEERKNKQIGFLATTPITELYLVSV